MIKVKSYVNDFDGYMFYVAEATRIHKSVTGRTKIMALQNLKNLIVEKAKKQMKEVA